MRLLLRTAAWDADAVRDDVRGFVVARLGDAAGVLICDETGFLTPIFTQRIGPQCGQSYW
jgi:hypothetical protein